MDKIPKRSNQLSDAPQSDKNNPQKGQLGSKQVTPTDSAPHLEKNHVHSQGQSLNSRQIAPYNVQTMIEFGQQHQWLALASAITQQGNSKHDLTTMMEALKNHNIKLPADIQTQAGLRFIELTASSVSDILHSSLPGDPLLALGVLEQIAQCHQQHDSSIGAIARLRVDEFLQQYQLSEADSEGLVQSMAARIYSLTSRKMEQLEETLLNSTTDTKMIKRIELSQNERRIEESLLAGVDKTSGVAT